MLCGGTGRFIFKTLVVGSVWARRSDEQVGATMHLGQAETFWHLESLYIRLVGGRRAKI